MIGKSGNKLFAYSHSPAVALFTDGEIYLDYYEFQHQCYFELPEKFSNWNESHVIVFKNLMDCQSYINYKKIIKYYSE